MALDPPLVRQNQDRLKQLRAFCSAARLQGISRAAEHVRLSQPAVSRLVRTLEKELAVELFERSGPRIALTPAGERLYRLATPLVEGMDRLPGTFAELHRGVASGDLDIATGQTSAAFVLPGYLKRFHERYPGIRVNVRVGSGSERLRWLRAYEVDIAFGAVDAPPPDLEFHRLFSSGTLLITPEDHPLAGRESVDIHEAAPYPAIAYASGQYVRQFGDLYLRQYGVVANVVLEVDGWNVIKLFVQAGLGIALVPDLCISDRDRVWSIPFDQYLPLRMYGALTRRDGILSLAARQFMQIVDSGPPAGGS